MEITHPPQHLEEEARMHAAVWDICSYSEGASSTVRQAMGSTSVRQYVNRQTQCIYKTAHHMCIYILLNQILNSNTA